MKQFQLRKTRFFFTIAPPESPYWSTVDGRGDEVKEHLSFSTSKSEHGKRLSFILGRLQVVAIKFP